MTIEFVLASGSPRRKELLEQMGVSFRIQTSLVDESFPPTVIPEEAVQQLALRKAESVARKEKSALVVGADTVVVLDNQIMGKPQDSSQAIEMLTQLQGRTHFVVSGIALVEVEQGKILRKHTDLKKTEVWMLSLTPTQIEWYVKTGEPLDKAGAYGIQGLGACLIDKIEGCYFNVVGMSLSLLNRMVNQMGYQLFDDFVK